MLVRPMEKRDPRRIADMAAALSAHEGQPPPPFAAEDVVHWGFGRDRRFEGVVAAIEGAVIGYALFHDAFNVGLGSPGLHMLDLFVEPRARRRGVARALMAAVGRACLDRGGEWLTWQSLPENAEAVAFYQRIGGRRFRAANFELSGSNLDFLLEMEPAEWR